MKAKKMISCLLATSMLAVSAISAVPSFAQIEETVVPTIDNAAVVVQGDVNAHQSMRIEGDVYAGGQVKFDNAGADYLDGDIISANPVSYQDEWSAILTEANRQGVDKVEEDMSKYLDQYFNDQYLADYSVRPETPDYENVVYTKEESWFTINEWTTWPVSYEKDENGYPYYVVSENTHFQSLGVQGGKLIIDTTNGPVYIKADDFSTSTANDRIGYVEVVGDNPAYLISPAADAFLNVVRTGNNEFDFGTGDLTWIVTPKNEWSPIGATYTNSKIKADIFCTEGVNNITFNASVIGDIVVDTPSVTFGNTFSVEGDIYAYGTDTFSFDGKVLGNVVTKANTVRLANSGQYNDERVKGNVNAIEASSLDISCAVFGNVVTSAETINITGGARDQYVANVVGTVYAPRADVKIFATSDNGIRRGQLIAKSLDIFGEGAVIWGHAGNAPAEVTPEPTEEPTPEPTLAPIPEGEEIDLTGTGYAYIFGYEPDHIERVSITNDEGIEVDSYWDVQIRMAPQDAVTREQVAAMIMRMIDQKYDTKDASYPVTSNIAAHAGTWYERGLAYIASTGAFDGIDYVDTGAVTRGEVAKLIAFGLNLTNTTTTNFVDIDDSEYKPYIEIMNAYGYMQGMGDDTFEPDRVMKRSEFCSVFNQIIDRQDALLVAADGTEVTPETYYFVDLNEDAWYTPVMLRATSAYDANGYVDIDTRLSNIRNTLDNYDSQKLF